jgi:hypothetical protein
MSDNPKPPYEQPSIEQIDTGDAPISTEAGQTGGSTLPLD